jgi:hypothetical protein
MPMGNGRPRRRMGAPWAPGAGLLLPRFRVILQKANALFESGQYAQAALLLEDLAGKACQRGGPRAPFLFVRAARAHALSGQAAHSVELFRAAVDTLAASGGAALLFPPARRLLADLEGNGHAAEAQEVKKIISGTPGWTEAAPAAAAARPVLPTHCPQCGAAIRSDEVEWIDDQTAECTYCGSPVR